jgi:3-methyladenine DNA glycosylase AlkD
MLIGDPEDLIHKAVGGVLRFAGDKDEARLVTFLERHGATMPRVMLRYAIEHFDKDERARFLALGKR